jgi:hypothetical protein
MYAITHALHLVTILTNRRTLFTGAVSTLFTTYLTDGAVPVHPPECSKHNPSFVLFGL